MRDAGPAYLTPPELARRYGVKPDKILAWIRSGELRAINLVERPGGRPRWKISEADLLIFEQRRAATGPAPRTRRRRKDPAVIEFF